jgi:hypothetical protein
MAMFNLGDMVEFPDNRNNILQGRVIKINKKNLTILIDGRKQWNVHPGYLKLIS